MQGPPSTPTTPTTSREAAANHDIQGPWPLLPPLLLLMYALRKDAMWARKVWFAPPPCGCDRDPDTGRNAEHLGGRSRQRKGEWGSPQLLEAIPAITSSLSCVIVAENPRRVWRSEGCRDGGAWKGESPGPDHSKCRAQCCKRDFCLSPLGKLVPCPCLPS